MIRKISVFLVLFGALFFSLVGSSLAVYSWVDEKGEIHITDYPRPGKSTEQAPGAESEQVKTVVPPDAQQANPPVPVQGVKPTLRDQTATPPAVSLPATQPSQTAQMAQPVAPVTQMPMHQTKQDVAPAAGATPPLPPDRAATVNKLEQHTDAPAASVRGTAPPANVVAAFLAGFMMIFSLVMAVLYVYFSLCMFLIARRLNVPAAWTAWVPILQVWPLLASAGKPCWWVLLLFIPFVNIIISTYLWMCIAENLGRNKWLGVLILVPVVQLVLPGVLAFSGKDGPATPGPVAAY